MKISKKILKRIIKEERAKLLKENRMETWALLEQIQDMGVSDAQILEYLLGSWMPGHDAQRSLEDYLESELGM